MDWKRTCLVISWSLEACAEGLSNGSMANDSTPGKSRAKTSLPCQARVTADSARPPSGITLLGQSRERGTSWRSSESRRKHDWRRHETGARHNTMSLPITACLARVLRASACAKLCTGLRRVGAMSESTGTKVQSKKRGRMCKKDGNGGQMQET